MILYKIVMAILIVGAVSSGINESGLYKMALPSSRAAVTEAQVTDYQTGLVEHPLGPFAILEVIWSFLKVMAAACLALVTIIPLMLAWGFPLWAAGMVQIPVWFLEAVGLYQLVTGYQVTGME